MRNLLLLFFIAVSLGVVACQKAPRLGYAELPHVVKKRQDLKEKLLQLQPESLRSAAGQEALWLADTAYKAAAAIARYNDPIFVNWLNNRAVNSRRNYRQRGLCWHYQHDLYRELRRRPLKYYELGCCLRDQGRGGEHHVVYVKAKSGKWPSILMLDAWWMSGRLVVEEAEDMEDWMDDPKCAARLNVIYPEGHKLPLEHWAMVRTGSSYGEYIYSDLPAARNTAQWKYMQKQMKKGLQARKGKPFDY